MDGKGLASVRRRKAYSCMAVLRRLFDAAHDVQPAADVLARGAARLAGRGLVHVGRALVGLVGGEDARLQGGPFLVAVLVLAEGETGLDLFCLVCGSCHGEISCYLIRNIPSFFFLVFTVSKKPFGYHCFVSEQDGLADQPVDALDHVHRKLVVGHDLGELGLADGADRRHVRDAVFSMTSLSACMRGIAPLTRRSSSSSVSMPPPPPQQ
jgi:hypothetical protein